MKDSWRNTPHRRGAIQGFVGAAVTTVVSSIGHRPAMAGGRLATTPAVFDPSSDGAIIWCLCDGPAEIVAELAPNASFRSPVRSLPVATSAQTGFTCRIEFSNLEPNTQYFYRLHLDGVASPSIGRFRTAPLDDREFRFVFSADTDAGFRPFRLLETMRQQQPDFFLHLGDTIYVDHPKKLFVGNLAQYRAKHREIRSDQYLQSLMLEVPVMATWDDHEIQDNADSSHGSLNDGKRAFLEFWPNRSREPGGIHRRLSWGPLADIFILDCRQFRRKASGPDDPDATMLGPEQRKWLMQELLQSRASFKFIATSVPFNTNATDSWGGFAIEKSIIADFIQTKAIKGVVFLSADWHMATDLSNKNFREIVTGPIGAAPHFSLKPKSETFRRTRGKFHLGDEPNFALVTVKPGKGDVVPSAEVAIIDTAGRRRYTTTFTAAT